MSRLGTSAQMGLFLIAIMLIIGIGAPWLAPYDPFLLHEGALRLPPRFIEGGHPDFWLGTDDVGRDLLSRLIYGTRLSLFVGLSVVALALSSGLILGTLAGFYRGKLDRLIMGLIDLLMALPSILLALVVVAILGPGLLNAIVAVALVAIPGFTRVVRAKVLEVSAQDYIMTARSLGASHWRIIIFHLLPNCLGPIIVQASLGISDAILNVAALGFLGLGAEPPTAEWGMMLSEARGYIQSSPWMVTLPGLCILVAVIAFNLTGDGLRDWLDPKTRVLKQKA